MNLKQAIGKAAEVFDASDLEDATLESKLLLRHVLKMSSPQLYLALDKQLNTEQEEAFWSLVKRRLTGEPTAYITGHREFFGIDFSVDHRVLIPRPESEMLVEMALDLAQNRDINTIADIGTGCGAIAISLALNLPHAEIYATDISASAIDVALFNCRRHDVADRIRLLQGSMVDPLPEPVDLIVANLPYVNETELIPPSPLSFEPQTALNGGPDGLEKIRELCQRAGNRLRPYGCLFMEIGGGQGPAVTELLQNLFPEAEVKITPDLSGTGRIASLILPQSNLTLATH